MKFRGVKECKRIYGLSRMALVNYEKEGAIKPLTEKKSEGNFVTLECLLAFDKDEDKGRVLALMRKFSSLARVEDRIAKLRKEIGEEKNEYKKNKLRSDLRRLKGELRLLIQSLLDSGESESATQQTVDRKMEWVRDLTHIRQKKLASSLRSPRPLLH